MSDNKRSEESYKNMSGINSKASEYETEITECLRLVNFDFSKPGAWTKRPGTTLWATGFSGQIGSMTEFERLNGFSQIIVGANNSLYSSIGGAATQFLTSQSNINWDFTTFVDRLFAFNGNTSQRYDGSTAWAYSLPPGISGAFNATFGFGTSIGGGLFAGLWDIGDTGTGITVSITVGYGYLNDRGYMGPVGNGLTLTFYGGTFNAITAQGMTSPPGYGITSLLIYHTDINGPDLYWYQFDRFPSNPGATLVLSYDSPDFTPYTLFKKTIASGFVSKDSIGYTLKPRYAEIVNNQLFAAGFSAALSTVRWSEVGEPEQVDPTWFNEVRTNDGDRITGLRSFLGDGIITKRRSWHRFRANNPEDVTFGEISTEYGNLSNKCLVVHDSDLYGLDDKGVVLYNGAEIKLISDKVEPVFRRMNVAAALDNACAINNRLRNELWFAFPVDGATMNNMLVVYDYLVNAWSTWSGLNVSSLGYFHGGTFSPRGFYGGYTGSVRNFGSSLTGDDGQGFTCLVQSRFHSGEGESITKLYRQLFLNLTATGVTTAIGVNLYTDYGTTPVYMTTLQQSPFQSRIDFGVQCKSISVELANFSSTASIQIPGYALKYRVLRNE